MFERIKRKNEKTQRTYRILEKLHRLHLWFESQGKEETRSLSQSIYRLFGTRKAQPDRGKKKSWIPLKNCIFSFKRFWIKATKERRIPLLNRVFFRLFLSADSIRKKERDWEGTYRYQKTISINKRTSSMDTFKNMLIYRPN